MDISLLIRKIYLRIKNKKVIEDIFVDKVKNVLLNSKKAINVQRPSGRTNEIPKSLIEEILKPLNFEIINIDIVNNLNTNLSNEELKKYFYTIMDKDKALCKILNDFFYELLPVAEKNKLFLLIQEKPIPIGGFTFNDLVDYSIVLDKIESVIFYRCIFNNINSSLIIKADEKDLLFRKCIFHGEWEYIKTKNTLYSECEFNDYLHQNLQEKKITVSSLLFFNCKFENVYCEGIHFEKRLFKYNNNFKHKSIKKLELLNCIFEEKMIISSFDMNDKETSFKVKKLNFSHSIFTNNAKVKLQLCEIEEAIFYNTKFKDLADFYQTKFNKVNFERTDFERISVFSEVEFNCDVDFKYTKFLGKSIFRDTVITKKYSLNLRDSIFDAEANFLDITSNKGKLEDIKIKNRETARIIKNFYDNSNNIIEANRFYKLEMLEREEELFEDRKENKNFFEWLTFKFHGISSNHSQDWILSFFWIIFFTYTFGIIKFVNCQLSNTYELIIVDLIILFFSTAISIYILKYKKIYSFIFLSIYYLGYSFLTDDYILKDFSTNINPFSIMTGKTDLTFSVFMYKITIAYLIYQLIISVRQNTRRK